MYHIAEVYRDSIDNMRAEREQATGIKLRGYKSDMWVNPEFISVQLPVNVIAFNLCPTSRDLYLEKICNIRTEETFERYKGRVIDSLYKACHLGCQKYILNKKKKLSLDKYIGKLRNRLIKESKQEYSSIFNHLTPKPTTAQTNELDTILRKIVDSESKMAEGIIESELRRVEGATQEGIFDEYLNFNTKVILFSPHIGFTSKVAPDFIYKHEVIGDIKTGVWHDFLINSAVAYALAYEEHTRRDMDFGTILNPQFPPTKNTPVYHHTAVVYLSDARRRTFKAVRDRKLQLMQTPSDPGKPTNKTDCNSACPHVSNCWSLTDGK
jgi:CRISPR/Cas system-associated exonuclease Cas4 (RecB family)